MLHRREFTYMQFKLRDYQQECVDVIDGEGKEGCHLIAMATGLGKTAVFSRIKRRRRTLILSHRDELVHQPEKYYKGGSFGVERAEEHADGGMWCLPVCSPYPGTPGFPDTP